MKDKLKEIRGHLMTGVSHMIPFVVAGGVLIAFSIMLSGVEAGTGANVTSPVLQKLMTLGSAAFTLMVPILAGYIAYSIADRPGLAPGMVAGYLAGQIGAGFLGGIIAGLLAGYIAAWIKSWQVPEVIRPVMPIFVIPLLSTIIVGSLMQYVIGVPVSNAMAGLTAWLQGMSEGSQVIFGIILGAMIAFDMGGPVNKTAFLFGTGLIEQGVYNVMGPIAVAICIPPLSMALATMLAPAKYTKEEIQAGKGAFFMGLIGITEGAIPFAAADPIRVIPSIMTGSAIGSVIAMLAGVGDHAPHGGPIVLPVVDNRIMFIVAAIIGIIVSAAMVNLLKKPIAETELAEDESEDLELEFELD
ncbi:PTS fructose transporter subunit EIIC [Halanaerobium salsuginis]|uniref:PTS system IIC component, Fru family n=1 Tax=Halanaerobium salsuginis TaxID=29563 RepID=A0A1I4HIQ6_9FIRM|nr:PTS fructose transporter subunit EIIC [Halanaerobium salsuginis]SFL41276.1 PTS system IIC component, Fru family [Halanaerobium salsuginis]